MSQAQIAVHGLRNSLLVANMPTASTAQILGNNESVEPFTRLVMEKVTKVLRAVYPQHGKL